MTPKVFKNTSEIIKYYVNIFSNSNIVGVDMTIGNGNDIYYLAKIVGAKSKLYGFDINPSAIINTNNKLREIKNKEIQIILDSHDEIDKYVNEQIDLVIYNLGYLPKGNKNITTNYSTVINSLKKVLKQLSINGIILITFYPGHVSGKLESEYIEEFLKNLNQKKFNILKYCFINQINNPPFVIVIERLN